MTEQPKKKIALVLSGGVSAGAYIAGALNELICVLNRSDQYEIDIITGGSAGATTAALVAHGLLYRDGDARLHKTWVEDVDFFKMIENETESPKDAPEQITLLNGTVIESIAKQAIEWTADDTWKKKRARCCAPNLTLAMTLSNCTSLPYKTGVDVPTADGDTPFIQYRNAEQQTFKLSAEADRTQALWERITTVARASSAIPFVLPRVKLARNPKDTCHYLREPLNVPAQDFWYYDGGTFNNLPIGLAAHYISLETELTVEGLVNRTIIVINPWDASDEVKEVPTSAPDLLDFGLRLIAGIRNEAGTIEFHIDDRPTPTPANQSPSTSDGQSDDLGPRAVPGQPPLYESLIESMGMVTPAEGSEPLRCKYFGHLSAFLDPAFREYDYRRGAADARRLLPSLLITDQCPREPGFYEPDKDERFNKVDLRRYENLANIKSTLPEDEFKGKPIKDILEDRLEKRIDYLLRAIASRVDSLLAPVVALIADSQIDMHKILPRVWNKAEPQNPQGIPGKGSAPSEDATRS